MSAPGWRLPSPMVDDRPTYLAHALALAALYGPGPWPNGGGPVPDTRPSSGQRPGLISPVVSEGIRTHHMASGDGRSADAATLADQIQALVWHQPTMGALESLHDAAAVVPPVDVADALVQDLRERRLAPERLRQIGLWLAEYGTRRGPVAIGIILLGLAGDGRDRDLLLLLGALEDLTLYAVVALRDSQPDRDEAVFDLARRAHGWGRIHAVDRLAGTDDPQIKAWLLREGFRNEILDEYLAHTAATTGDLAGALAQDTIDEALLDGAGGILLALCNGGPARDMTDYPDGPLAIQRYLTHAGRWQPTLSRIAIVATLHRFITSAKADQLPWAASQRTRLSDRCAALTSRTDWRAVVDQTLTSDDSDEFHQAIWPATTLGIQFADRLRHHLRKSPYDIHLWFALVDDHEDLDGTLQLAAELLPLAALATGPGLDWGLGADDGPEHILDVIVSRLDAHPGKGWPLIRVALSNATIRNRNMALNALEAWPVEAIPSQAYEAVRDALRIEPDEKIRDRLRQVLRKEFPTWPS